MSRADEQLLNDYFKQRWSVTSAPSGGTTCVANTKTAVPRLNGASRNILEAIIFSVKNLTAAACTQTLEVREASITGTLLASVDIICPTAVTTADCYSQWYISAARAGTADYGHLSVSFNTVQASVSQKINICGWMEQAP